MMRFFRWFQLAAAAGTLGMVFDLGTGCGSTLIHNVNPCGTILNCDPLEYDLATNHNFPDYTLDPTCTIPGLCGGTPFPATPGTINATGQITTATNTGTGATTGNGT